MPMAALSLRRNESFRHVGAGGGGYGDPFERDPALVLEDVLDEKISREAAERDYGVVIDLAAAAIDEHATARLRSNGPGNRAPSPGRGGGR
jgi:N-methylhydantoinase B